MSTSTEAKTRRPGAHDPGCLGTIAILVVLLVPAVLAVIAVVNVADTTHELDALRPAGLAFLAWLLLPAAYVVAPWLRRWEGRIPVLPICVAAAIAFAFTLWLVRPQAPDGSRFDRTYQQAAAELDDDVRVALDEVAPGRWERSADRDVTVCDDVFGRSRGAVYGVLDYQLSDMLTESQFRTFRSRVSGPDRDIQAPAFGRPVSYRGQDEDRFVIRVENFDRAGASTIEVVTPCLRQISTG